MPNALKIARQALDRAIRTLPGDYAARRVRRVAFVSSAKAIMTALHQTLSARIPRTVVCNVSAMVCALDSQNCTLLDSLTRVFRSSLDSQDCPAAAATCSANNVCETCTDDSACALCPPNTVCTPLFQEVDGTARRRLMNHEAITRLSCRMCGEAALECTGNRPYCDYGVCVQCVSDGDCDSVAPYCDNQGACRPCADGTTSCLVRAAQTVCSSNADCSSTPLTPICDDTDPAVPAKCIECFSDMDCAFPAAYCRNDHTCVACLSDNDCGVPNPYCSPVTNRCVACVNDSQCSSPLPYCLQTVGECVQCTQSSECLSQAQPACELSGYTCVECTEDSFCAGSLNPFCDTEEYQCSTSCSTDADCPAAFPTCLSSGKCVDPTPPPTPTPPTCTTPVAPTNVRVSATTGTGVIICWNAPTAATQCNVDRYKLTLTSGSTNIPSTTSGTNLCFELLLPCDQSYQITVQSDSDEGGPGGTSSALSFASASCATCTTPPTAPGNLQTVSGTTSGATVSLDLSWDAATGANEYSYFCVVPGGTCNDENSAVGSGVGTTTTGTTGSVTSLAPYTSYTCWVKATNDCGTTCTSTGASGSTSCVAAPAVPTGVAVDAGPTSGSSVDLEISWDSISDATGYSYFCVPAGQTCADTSNAAGSGVGDTPCTSASVTSLDPYTSYTCWVKTLNDCGSTCLTTGVTQSTSCVTDPGAPTSLSTTSTTSGSGVTSSSIQVTWDSIADAIGYTYFCVAAGGTCSDTINAAGSGLGTVSGPQTGTVARSVTGLSPSTTFDCFATSVNDCGSTCSSAGSRVTTPCNVAPSSPMPTLTAPSGGVTMGVNWASVTDPSVTQQEVFCTLTSVLDSCPDPTTQATGTVNVLTSGFSSANSYTVQGLSSNTAYNCFVRVTNACGTTCSTAATLSTQCASYPAAPSDVAMTPDASTGGKLDVTWTGVAGETYLVKCVDDTSGTSTCSDVAAGNGVVAGACLGTACSASVTGLTDEIPYACCVVPTDTSGCSGSAGVSANTSKPCTTPVPATISSVVSSASGTLTVSWTASSNAVSYEYFCTNSPGTCSSTPVGTGSTEASSSPGNVVGLTAGSYDCFVETVNSCGTTCSTGSTGIVCDNSAPANLQLTGATDTQLELTFDAVIGASSYQAFCVLKVGTGAGTQTCGDTAQGSGVMTITDDSSASYTAIVTSLTQNTEYVCYVKSVASSGCVSPCSSGAGYITSVTGTSSLLAEATLTTLVFNDGAGPGSPLPTEKQPVSAYDETTCTNANEFPDDNSGNARRALQIILNVEGWDKPSYEGSVDIQAKFYKALSDLSDAVGTGPVCMRTFNVDNSRHGAGVKTRMWFDTQQDCIDFATYVRARWGPNGDGTQQAGNTFRDINFLNNNQFDTATFGDSTKSYNGQGGVTIRMITNPQSKCHKWKFPSQSVCSAQLNYYSAGTTSMPASPTRNSDTNECPDENDLADLAAATNSRGAWQVITSFSARNKNSGMSLLLLWLMLNFDVGSQWFAHLRRQALTAALLLQVGATLVTQTTTSSANTYTWRGKNTSRTWDMRIPQCSRSRPSTTLQLALECT